MCFEINFINLKWEGGLIYSGEGGRFVSRQLRKIHNELAMKCDRLSFFFISRLNKRKKKEKKQSIIGVNS